MRDIAALLNQGMNRSPVAPGMTAGTLVPDGKCWKCRRGEPLEGHDACGPCLVWLRGDDLEDEA